MSLCGHLDAKFDNPHQNKWKRRKLCWWRRIWREKRFRGWGYVFLKFQPF